MRHSGLLRLGTAAIVIIAVAAAVIHTLNAPGYGIITVPKPVAEVSPPSKPKTYSGKYVSFTVPAHYVVSTGQLSGGFLEVVNLLSTDHSAKYASIGVYRGLLANDSGLAFRRAHSDIYKEVQINGDPVFSKTQDGSEYTGFMTHDGLVASISFTSAYSKNLSGDYQAVASSWQWK